MKRNAIIIILLVTLTILCTVAGTYAIAIDVKEEDGIYELVDTITVRDIFTDTDGNYNELYYDVVRELDIDENTANILMESSYINDALQIVLNSIVDYSANGNSSAKLSNDEIYQLIEESVNKTNNISEEVKSRIISKSLYYKEDISDYVYSIDINVIEGI